MGFARRSGRAERRKGDCPFSCIFFIPSKSSLCRTALCIMPKPCKSETLSFHRLASPAPSFICSHGRRNGSNLHRTPLGGITTLPALQIGGNRSNIRSISGTERFNENPSCKKIISCSFSHHSYETVAYRFFNRVSRFIDRVSNFTDRVSNF